MYYCAYFRFFKASEFKTLKLFKTHFWPNSFFVEIIILDLAKSSPTCWILKITKSHKSTHPTECSYVVYTSSVLYVNSSFRSLIGNVTLKNELFVVYMYVCIGVDIFSRDLIVVHSMHPRQLGTKDSGRLIITVTLFLCCLV